MKHLVPMLLLAFVISVTSLTGQDNYDLTIKRVIGGYKYNNEFYYKENLSSIFKDYPLLMNRYDKALHADKLANNLGYFTLGTIGFGFAAIAIDNTSSSRHCDLICLTTGDKIGLISIFIVAPITGTFALFEYFHFIRKLKRVVMKFNNTKLDKYGRKVEQPSIGLASKGVGLKISF